MKTKIIYKLIGSFLLIFSFLLPDGFGQVIIWKETFEQNPLGANPFESWQTDPSTWQWSPDGKAGRGTFWNNRKGIQSKSRGGAMFFDADSQFDPTTSNELLGQLTSPIIPWNPTSRRVFLQFYQYYRNHWSNATIEILNLEGQIIAELPVNEIVGTNQETSNKDLVIIDISEFLFTLFEGFQLRFTFIGDYYFWIIDDIQIVLDQPIYKETFPRYVGDSLTAFGRPYDVGCDSAAFVKNEIVIQFDDSATEQEKQALRDTFGVINFEACDCGNIELWRLGPTMPFNSGASPSSSGASLGINERALASNGRSKVKGADVNKYNWNELKAAIDLNFGMQNVPPDIIPATSEGDIIIALLDTGIDYLDNRLSSLIWKNPNLEENVCLESDFLGWNAVDKNNNPRDDHSHGTHLAGIMKDQLNLIESSCPDFRIMPLKTHDSDGFSDLFASTCMFYYALKNGAKVINCSWGWIGDSSLVLANAIDSARLNYNAVVVAATGNDSLNLVEHQQYPACYQHDNVIAVASLSANQEKVSPFSNFSSTFTDIAAIGENVINTIPRYLNEEGIEEKNGTSMAAPAVSAAIAIAYCGGISTTYQEAIDQVLFCANQNPNHSREILNGNQLNISECLVVQTNFHSNLEHHFTIGPNPVSTQLNVLINKAIFQRGKIILSNTIGQQMEVLPFHRLTKNEVFTINMNPYPPGLYFLSTLIKGETWTTKVVKK